jgi:hypothetical protein
MAPVRGDIAPPKTAVQGGNVHVDHATLRIVEAGRGVGYSVGLVGEVDETWALRFRNLKTHARLFSRFALDPVARMVSFARETTDTPADVIDALQALDTLVGRVNALPRTDS